MSRRRRALLAVPLLLSLGWAVALCASTAGASLVAAQATPEALVEALQRTPADPALHEQLGALLARTAASPSEAQAALQHLATALELRPTSPYAWAALAEARYRLGVADETFDAALVRAAELGPNEPAVQETLALYGLARWSELSATAREAVDRMIVAGMHRDAAAMLQIAERRGRLEAVCGHLDAAAPGKLAQVCKRREVRP